MKQVNTMSQCNYIKKLIDEADKPDLLPFQANEHILGCSDCGSFATQRASLRKLMASGRRVSAPVNFDAVLGARLAEVKGRRGFSWLSSPGYLRLGAATAGLVIMIFAAQYAGLFGNHPMRTSQPQIAVIQPPQVNEKPDSVAVPTLQPAVTAAASLSVGASRGQRVRHVDSTTRGSAVPAGYFTAEDGGVVLVRGRNGDLEVPMPTVSVGAQPLLYVSGGQRTVRNVSASF